MCKLTKALYGLRQAPRTWYAMFSSYLLQLGFSSSKAGTSLFILQQDTSLALVLIYVDDIVITGSDSGYISDLIKLLSKKFIMMD